MPELCPHCGCALTLVFDYIERSTDWLCATCSPLLGYPASQPMKGDETPGA